MRSKITGGLAVVLLTAFLVVLMRIATLPLESGEAYPPYSSLRADPRGSMAFYESLAALSELQVSRSFLPLPKLKGVQATILLLGEGLADASAWSEEELKFYESLASNGARVVIAFLPVPPLVSGRASRARPARLPHIVTRWGVAVETYEATEDQAEAAGSMPRETWSYFELEPKAVWDVLYKNSEDDPVLISRTFGKGRILLLTESYALSNEGLRAERNVNLIATLTGPNQQIIFDESHIGVTNTGSVGALIRRYRLTGAFAVALLLGLLFLWKNSTSLLPRTPEPGGALAEGADAQSGLINLLKRSVPVEHLAQACWQRWKDTRALGRPVSDLRVQRAELELNTASSPAGAYRNIQRILTEKT